MSCAKCHDEFRAVPTLDGRFAVVQGHGAEQLTVGIVHGEQAALTMAAALNGGPVRTVAAGGRWEGGRSQGAVISETVNSNL